MSHPTRRCSLLLIALTAVSPRLVAAEPPSARLVNISARVALGGNAGTPIPGFVVAGTGQKQVIVRAAGPAQIGRAHV